MNKREASQRYQATGDSLFNQGRKQLVLDMKKYQHALVRSALRSAMNRVRQGLPQYFPAISQIQNSTFATVE